MCESTNIQGLSKSFENSTYSYSSHTIAPLSPSSLCYPWSASYHLSNHITVYRIFTSHMHALLYISSFKPYAARSFFPCVQTITVHFDQLYSQTLFQFQLFFSPVYFSVYVDKIIIYICTFLTVNKIKSPIWSEAPSAESTTTVRSAIINYLQ